MTSILRHPIKSRATWTGAQFNASQDWIHQLDRDELAEIDSALSVVKSRGCELFDISSDDFPLPELGARLAEVRDELDQGRGFHLFRGLPIARYRLQEARLIFWGLAQHLGKPEPQDGAGSLMHDVCDTGQSVRHTPNVRGFQTSNELQFHNDGGDAFLLLCLQVAKSGGTSKLASVAALFNRVLELRPDLAEVLQRPFHFDARQQQPSGLPMVQVVPILLWYGARMHVIYKRGYIKTAQRFEQVPRLSALQSEALDLIDRICGDPGFCLSFEMQPGDIQFGSNHSVLHSRTEYVDHDEIAKQRHLLRVWLTLPNGRPLPPEFKLTREFAHTYARRHAESLETSPVRP